MSNLSNRGFLLTLVSLGIGIGTWLAMAENSNSTVVGQERERITIRKVKRVKRPKFDQQKWQLTFFDNLFEQGLVGPRPSASDLAAQALAQKNAGTATNIPDSAAPSSGGFAWSQYVGSEVLEDEIKSLQQALNTQITTPAKFKTEYAKVRQTFSMLSMLFGVIREYDGDVRFKKFAPVAQFDFERAAANARVGSIQAYESCKTRKEFLMEMVRGGNFPSDAKAPAELDWGNVVELVPIMKRLKATRETAKPFMASKSAFTQNLESVYHEANLVAAMGQVLCKENMENADDDDYKSLAVAMQQAATETVQACKNNDYEAASTAYNKMIQSCENCHGDWR